MDRECNFPKFLEQWEPNDEPSDLFYCMLEYSKILIERLNRDFNKFCNDFDNCILCHGERYREEIVFAMHFIDDYYLIIESENYKVNKFELCNSSMNSLYPKEDNPYLWI